MWKGMVISMRKRMLAYLSYMDQILAHELPVTAVFDADGNYEDTTLKDIMPTRKEYEKLLARHLEQIAFFSHERLIHLLVTLMFAGLAFAVFFFCITEVSLGLLLLLAALMILLVPYIMHYYLLENGVQKMYRQYDELVKRMK